VANGAVYCRGGACQYRVPPPAPAPWLEVLPFLPTYGKDQQEFCTGLSCIPGMGMPSDDKMGGWNAMCTAAMSASMVGNDWNRDMDQLKRTALTWCSKLGLLDAVSPCGAFANIFVMANTGTINNPSVGDKLSICTNVWLFMGAMKQAQVDLKLLKELIPGGSSLVQEGEEFGMGAVGPKSRRGKEWIQHLKKMGKKFPENPSQQPDTGALGKFMSGGDTPRVSLITETSGTREQTACRAQRAAAFLQETGYAFGPPAPAVYEPPDPTPPRPAPQPKQSPLAPPAPVMPTGFPFAIGDSAQQPPPPPPPPTVLRGFGGGRGFEPPPPAPSSPMPQFPPQAPLPAMLQQSVGVPAMMMQQQNGLIPAFTNQAAMAGAQPPVPSATQGFDSSGDSSGDAPSADYDNLPLPDPTDAGAAFLQESTSTKVSPEEARARSQFADVSAFEKPKYLQNPVCRFGIHEVPQSQVKYQIAPGVPPVELDGDLLQFCAAEFSEIGAGFTQTASDFIQMTKDWCGYQSAMVAWIGRGDELGHPDWNFRRCSGMAYLVTLAMRDHLDSPAGFPGGAVCTNIFPIMGAMRRLEKLIMATPPPWSIQPERKLDAGRLSLSTPVADPEAVAAVLKATQEYAAKLMGKLRGQRDAFNDLNTAKMDESSFESPPVAAAQPQVSAPPLPQSLLELWVEKHKHLLEEPLLARGKAVNSTRAA